MQRRSKEKKVRSLQSQTRPGLESKMKPKPVTEGNFVGDKLKDKVALITGGDSGIGRAVALLFAQHGAKIAIAYLSEHSDAEATKKMVNEYGECLLLPGDISKENQCKKVVSQTYKKFGKLDILVNNVGLHYESKKLEDISTKQLIKTFSTNLFSYIWISKAALPKMKKGSCIINTASVTAYRGSATLIDYSATKGAIVSFTRSLSSNLAKKGIRVNGVAPGPIWTPLIASSFSPKRVAEFGSDAPIGRVGEPVEVAPCYLFLASEDASYITGQFLHPNGGEIING
jgi:NAD(P)-dependent dehydrogenase (short-subunit alcohol dehydrogenase family)